MGTKGLWRNFYWECMKREDCVVLVISSVIYFYYIVLLTCTKKLPCLKVLLTCTRNMGFRKWKSRCWEKRLQVYILQWGNTQYPPSGMISFRIRHKLGIKHFHHAWDKLFPQFFSSCFSSSSFIALGRKELIYDVDKHTKEIYSSSIVGLQLLKAKTVHRKP